VAIAIRTAGHAGAVNPAHRPDPLDPGAPERPSPPHTPVPQGPADPPDPNPTACAAQRKPVV
jgi:hypothetical protein